MEWIVVFSAVVFLLMIVLVTLSAIRDDPGGDSHKTGESNSASPDSKK